MNFGFSFPLLLALLLPWSGLMWWRWNCRDRERRQVGAWDLWRKIAAQGIVSSGRNRRLKHLNYWLEAGAGLLLITALAGPFLAPDAGRDLSYLVVLDNGSAMSAPIRRVQVKEALETLAREWNCSIDSLEIVRIPATVESDPDGFRASSKIDWNREIELRRHRADRVALLTDDASQSAPVASDVRIFMIRGAIKNIGITGFSRLAQVESRAQDELWIETSRALAEEIKELALSAQGPLTRSWVLEFSAESRTAEILELIPEGGGPLRLSLNRAAIKDDIPADDSLVVNPVAQQRWVVNADLSAFVDLGRASGRRTVVSLGRSSGVSPQNQFLDILITRFRRPNEEASLVVAKEKMTTDSILETEVFAPSRPCRGPWEWLDPNLADLPRSWRPRQIRPVTQPKGLDDSTWEVLARIGEDVVIARDALRQVTYCGIDFGIDSNARSALFPVLAIRLLRDLESRRGSVEAGSKSAPGYLNRELDGRETSGATSDIPRRRELDPATASRSSASEIRSPQRLEAVLAGLAFLTVLVLLIRRTNLLPLRTFWRRARGIAPSPSRPPK